MIRLTTPLIPLFRRVGELGNRVRSELRNRATARLEARFEALAAKLVEQSTHSIAEPHVFGITSCSAGEGVSTVARKIAIAFARSRSTLLIDASGEGTELTEFFGDCVSAPNPERPLRDCICPTGIENLSALSANESSLPSASTDELRGLMDEFKKDFDLIVVDMPHADEQSDRYGMAAAVDGVVLVVEPEAVSVADANRAKVSLQQAGANLQGVVINKEKNPWGLAIESLVAGFKRVRTG